jgi:uncharacterized protein involved in exopolysaccharide biosynthesis
MTEMDKKGQPQMVYVHQPAVRGDEQEIDTGRIMSLFLERRGFAVKCSCGVAALGLIVSLLIPKTYESTTVVQIASDSSNIKTSGALMAMAAFSGGNANANVDNYIALMKSRTVIEPIVAKLEYEDGLFRTADEKKQRAIAEAGKWAEKNLTIENPKGTNLISITANAKIPEKAQEISQAVADNFLTMQTELNQKQQSLLIKFLDERTKAAYEDSVEAGKKFAEYQKEHQIYSPSEQAKMAVSRMDAYTNKLADLNTQQQAMQAELATTSQQLSGLNIKSKNYQINDNETVQKLRQQIANKEVTLTTLLSKYTDKHPDIQNTKRELQQLQKSLSKEVNAIVNSETAAMSPQQATLISKKLNAEVSLKVAQISEQAVQEKYEKEQEKLEDFPQAVREYMDLQQDAEMKQKIYMNLVSQAEAAKIQEAKDSMDIQVVDPANLPLEDMPAKPSKTKYTTIGFVLGFLIAVIRACYSYWREEKNA